ncbi:hypothetical protein PF005_g14208 [Phytophthora fragariae]|uniref:Uncharacterized protein n=1 Tax=Phytophthora fragariae TaxID=53985 RepID=A0A6A3ESW1_9STRA|nr:hypothetical protein PF003_g15423 [Phytophthora fragariae]KAE8934540.1 hypothetical protein PF009_g15493 [Phytophthora fragariae]KAE9013978.1 hypothetical protein PF011_g8248 [Phytophthora fragariae]KAE9103147.1 hypothetical protein PF010_g13846 [Phytophthora fragariae]KAE9103320.1 hypothetical protein PF007_g14456 [Phytophthora fragariae]
MEAISDISTELFYFVTVSVSSIGAACYESRSELTWLAAGAVIWMITEPIRGIGSRFVSEISTFALKWALLAKLCVRRYCRYIRGPAVQGQPLRVKSWKMFEALLATPIVVLEARKARDDGLGRLLYKWADAFYEYWCVFLPESWTYARRVTSKYYAGLTWSRTGRLPGPGCYGNYSGRLGLYSPTPSSTEFYSSTNSSSGPVAGRLDS